MKRTFAIAGIILTAFAEIYGAMVLVPAGNLILPFRRDSVEIRIPVHAYFLDTYPISQLDYRDFLITHPPYQKNYIPRLFADKGYLKSWNDGLIPGMNPEQFPVTDISWYAAKEYCACQGKRLPTTAEWEWAAATTSPSKDSLQAFILGWYAKPYSQTMAKIGTGTHHENGLQDLFGVVWEWTSDFGAFGFSGLTNRGVEDSSTFCGAGSTKANANSNYATTMRWAFRLSLKPDYTLGSLGFRCAKDSLGGKK